MPIDAEHPRPSADEATSTLGDLAAIGDRSRRAVRAMSTRLPLLLWGPVWTVGYALVALTSWRVAAPVGVALALVAAGVTWLPRRATVVTGRERRTMLSWWVVMASSPLLVAIITPAPASVVLLFLGALWGLGLLLHAVAVGDLALGAVGGVIVVAAAVTRALTPQLGELTFGLVAGLSMTVLGLARLRTPR